MHRMDKILEEDLYTIGYITPQDDTGLLSFDDFDRVFRIIQKHGELLWDVVHNELTLKRLKVLQNQEEAIGRIDKYIEEYRNLILETFGEEGEFIKVFEYVSKKIFSEFFISKSIYEQSRASFLQPNENMDHVFYNSLFVDTGRRIKEIQLQYDKLKAQNFIILQFEDSELTRDKTAEIFQISLQLET